MKTQTGYKLQRGMNVEVDPAKLPPSGVMMLGEMQALERWAMQLEAFAAQTDNIVERITLNEIAKALGEDLERVKRLLITVAEKTNAVATLPHLTDEKPPAGLLKN